MSVSAKTIDTLLDERRTFAPSPEFLANAKVTDQSLHDAAAADPEAFWAEQARKYVTWYRPFDKVLEWDLPFAKWFLGGELNVSYNCLDRHVEAGRGEKVAYHFEGEPGDTRSITYSELLAEVCRLANALRKLGIKRGDRVGDLHADDPGAADGDARLREDRRGPLGGLRRVQRRGAARPHQRRRPSVA